MSSDGSERRKNKRGIWGWLNPYHYNFERWAYTFQRVTGVAILLYVLGHLGDTSFFVGGPTGTGPSPSGWAFIGSIFENSFGHLILILIVLVLFFHGVNGVRLILAEFGLIFKKPSAIEYPYKPKSLSPVQKSLIWVGIGVAVLAALWAFLVLFEGMG
ncbi:MAG TPA: succinate dehydrogenase [Nitrososphaerales archaeon]|nr:succinate dehydrogenase [Nitrososphaerales archaeon]